MVGDAERGYAAPSPQPNLARGQTSLKLSTVAVAAAVTSPDGLHAPAANTLGNAAGDIADRDKSGASVKVVESGQRNG